MFLGVIMFPSCRDVPMKRARARLPASKWCLTEIFFFFFQFCQAATKPAKRTKLLPGSSVNIYVYEWEGGSSRYLFTPYLSVFYRTRGVDYPPINNEASRYIIECTYFIYTV